MSSQNTRTFESLLTGFSAGLDNILGQTAAAAGTSFVRELMPRGTAKGSSDWYSMCTETIGFESLADASSAQSSSISSSSRMPGVMWRENMNLNDTLAFFSTLNSNIPPRNDLPTPLSTLDDNGRPRFRFEQVRSDGRLTMTMFENNMPEIGRTVAEKILGGDQEINDNMSEIGLTVTEEIVNGDQDNNEGAKNESER